MLQLNSAMIFQKYDNVQFSDKELKWQVMVENILQNLPPCHEKELQPKLLCGTWGPCSYILDGTQIY